MDKRFNIIAYGAIVVFAVLFAALIGLFIVNPMIDKAKQQRLQHEQDAERLKYQSDSLHRAVEIAVDSIMEIKVKDSIQYIKEKATLSNKYFRIIKKYNEKISGIDSLNDLQLNSSFSVREMLSDSSVEVWRHYR